MGILVKVIGIGFAALCTAGIVMGLIDGENRFKEESRRLDEEFNAEMKAENERHKKEMEKIHREHEEWMKEREEKNRKWHEEFDKTIERINRDIYPDVTVRDDILKNAKMENGESAQEWLDRCFNRLENKNK